MPYYSPPPQPTGNPRYTKPKRKKKVPGCLVFLVLVIIIIGSGYLFLTIEPLQLTKTDLQPEPVVYGKLSLAQETALAHLNSTSSRNPELHEQSGAIRALSVNVNPGFPEDPQKQVQAFMRSNQTLYQINNFENEFFLTDLQRTDNNTVVLKYQQKIDELPVYSSELVVVLDRQGHIILVNGSYLTSTHQHYDTRLVLTLNAVIDSLANQGYILATGKSQIALTLFNPIVLGHDIGETTKAWIINALSSNGPVTIIVSADTGEILHEQLLIYMNFEILTSNHQFDWDTDYHIDDFTDDRDNVDYEAFFDKVCTDIKEQQQIIFNSKQDSQTIIETEINHLRSVIDNVLTIYRDQLNWEGYDNQNSYFAVILNLTDSELHKAFHLSKDVCGYPIIALNTTESLLSAEDIFTHEFQHAVTDERISGGLNHGMATAEAGALNEAYSDIFTTLVDNNHPWQIYHGDELIRDMANPGRPLLQVYHYDRFIKSGGVRSHFFSSQYGYAHQNSTIISHAAYLISEGGNKRGIQVEGIGINDMAKIFFDGQAYLPINATFFLARWATIQACEDFYDNSKPLVRNCDSVRNAFAIVGIGDPVQQPRLIERLSEIIDAWVNDIITYRSVLLENWHEKLEELGIQIDDFKTRTEQDLLNLITELALKWIFTISERFFQAIIEQACGSLAYMLLPVAIICIKKHLK